MGAGPSSRPGQGELAAAEATRSWGGCSSAVSLVLAPASWRPDIASSGL